MNVKLIKMWSGEDVVADVVSEDVAKVIIENPIVALPTSTGTLGFAPWSPLLVEKDTPLEVVCGYVVYINDPQESIVEQYEQQFSPIKTPSKKLVL